LTAELEEQTAQHKHAQRSRAWLMRAEPWVPHPWGNGLVTPTRGQYAGTAMTPNSALAETLGYGGAKAECNLERGPVIEPGREPSESERDDWPRQLEVRAPFPWFGGKSRVCEPVWRAFGADIPNYIEPFAGSLGMLLGRPGGPGKIETVNDRDRYLANFWRAVTADPMGVALAADWPVNEADLHARHRWLVNRDEFRERMHVDPDFYDVKIAGWWVWGLCQWIGGGWCNEPNNRKHPKLDGIGKGVHSDAARSRGAERVDEANRPELAGAGKGIHAGFASPRPGSRPNLGGSQGIHTDDGLHQKMPHLAIGTSDHFGGRGIITAQSRELFAMGLPALGNDRGLNGVSAIPCLEWFTLLQRRLRRVRVACGDWRRVLGDSVLGKGKNVGGRRPCGVFFDPPYSHAIRDPWLYAEDAPGISDEVRDWAIEHGDDPELRIALCGYAGEHVMPKGWTEFAWKGARGYAADDNNNRELERIWFSPHCLPPVPRQGSLF